VVKPETVIRWHRRGVRAYWHWKSSRVGGRSKIDREIRDLIRRMSKENPLWGALRIHGELLMLGIEVAQSTVARYMTKRQGAPSQGWKTFPRNHAAGIASLDLFVVRTLSFKLLYGLVILRHARRRLVSSLDHLIVFGEAHLRAVLKAYASYYNGVRTHLSLEKDAPDFRRIQKIGRIAAIPILAGMRNQYIRV